MVNDEQKWNKIFEKENVAAAIVVLYVCAADDVMLSMFPFFLFRLFADPCSIYANRKKMEENRKKERKQEKKPALSSQMNRHRISNRNKNALITINNSDINNYKQSYTCCCSFYDVLS